MRVSRDDILKAIEQNGGPKGTNFSGLDLSDIDLSARAVHELITQNPSDATMPPWCTTDKWGHVCVNLEGANFQEANLNGIKLGRAFIQNCNFREAQMQGVVLSECDAQGAVFSGADLEDADFHLANLRTARFGGATLRGAKLTEADLTDAYLLDVDLRDARLMGVILGDCLLQEKPKEFQDYLIHWKYNDVEYKLKRRYIDARDIYRRLKSVFLTQGYTAEAGKMHFRECMAEKQTHLPVHARACYSTALSQLPPKGLRRRFALWIFDARHLLSLCWAIMQEVSCGYGEYPLLPAFWALFFVIFFAVAYCCTNGLALPEGGNMAWQDYLIYSLGAFTGIGFFNYEATDLSTKFLTSLEAFCGLGSISLLMFALGVKLARS